MSFKEGHLTLGWGVVIGWLHLRAPQVRIPQWVGEDNGGFVQGQGVETRLARDQECCRLKNWAQSPQPKARISLKFHRAESTRTAPALFLLQAPWAYPVSPKSTAGYYRHAGATQHRPEMPASLLHLPVTAKIYPKLDTTTKPPTPEDNHRPETTEKFFFLYFFLFVGKDGNRQGKLHLLDISGKSSKPRVKSPIGRATKPQAVQFALTQGPNSLISTSS